MKRLILPLVAAVALSAMSIVTAMCSSPAIGCVVHISRRDRVHAAHCMPRAAHGSGRCVVDAGDRRRGVGNRSMHHRATTLTLHTGP